MNKALLVAVVVLFTFSCKRSSITEPTSYIYLSHPRVDSNDSIYGKVYGIDFSKYDMTLLGGDLALSSFTRNPEKIILPHLDSIFNFKSPTTLWSVGNHDKVSAKRYERTTLKKKYHAYQKDDITFITLDSQDSLSSIVGKQKDFFFSVLDTIQTSSVLVMTHKLIFMNDHPILDPQINEVCNANKGDLYHYHNPNNFQKEIYPKLLELREKGMQVIWVGGDLGYKKTSFEFIDDAGIIFLGNGLWYKKEGNKVLIFSKKKQKPITYKFTYLDTLLND